MVSGDEGSPGASADEGDGGDGADGGEERAPMYDQDGVHEIYREWRTVLEEYDHDPVLVAEAWVEPAERLVRYVRPDEMHQAFNFHFLTATWDTPALREAIDSGCEEALLLDNEGYVAEGSGENVFIVRNGRVHTPELTSCLEGVTRDTILNFVRDMGLELVERRITRDEVYIADEAFFTGTAAEVTPIRELDRIELGAGERGPITEKVQSAFFEIVNGRNPKYAHWLSKV